jgi:hypothetical protein
MGAPRAASDRKMLSKRAARRFFETIRSAAPAAGPLATLRRGFLEDEQLSDDAKLVGLVYAGCANPQGFAWPNREDVRTATQLDEQGIDRGMRQLLEGGFLVALTKSLKDRAGHSLVYRATGKILAGQNAGQRAPRPRR